ncbi:MAG: hypothetical protein NZ990_12930 [Myxococcota bacterium]|nr:hypothetical protein [Myxococcota bacterium]
MPRRHGERRDNGSRPGRDLARPVGIVVAFLLALVSVMGAAETAPADVGGTIAAGRAGDLRIHVLAFPLPLSVGESDWSILIRDADTGRLRDDLRVEIRLDGARASGGPLPGPRTASAGPGRHPGFYSARIRLDAQGGWRGNVIARSPEGAERTLGFGFRVRREESAWQAHWGSLLFPFALLSGFAWHQRRVLSAR